MTTAVAVTECEQIVLDYFAGYEGYSRKATSPRDLAQSICIECGLSRDMQLLVHDAILALRHAGVLKCKGEGRYSLAMIDA